MDTLPRSYCRGVDYQLNIKLALFSASNIGKQFFLDHLIVIFGLMLGLMVTFLAFWIRANIPARLEIVILF